MNQSYASLRIDTFQFNFKEWIGHDG